MASPPQVSSHKLLVGHYQRWRELTVREGEALQAENWLEVERLQTIKRDLQREILLTTDQVYADAERTGTRPPRLESELRSVVTELIALENQNRQLLAAHRERLQGQLEELDSTTRKLRQVGSMYAPARGAVWQSYS